MSIIQKKICDMLQEKKKESGLTMSTHNFHYSKKKHTHTKWAHMEPIHSYLNIYRHILRSFLHKNKKKQKNGVVNLQLPYN